jgi:hypothetical protein
MWIAIASLFIVLSFVGTSLFAWESGRRKGSDEAYGRAYAKYTQSKNKPTHD